MPVHLLAWGMEKEVVWKNPKQMASMGDDKIEK